MDISRHEIHRWTAADGDTVLARLDVPVGAVVPRASGGLLLAAGMGFAALSVEDGALRWLANVDAGDRMNDGKCDPAGRFFAGTMSYQRRPEAALYRLDSSGRVQQVRAGLAISNGLGWSPDGSLMYHVDTPTRRVDVFDYDLASGTFGNERVFAEIGATAGNPDGLTVDADGAVWVVLCRGRTVQRFSPDGRRDCAIELPVSRATSCTFGGPALDDLFVTSGRSDLTPDQLAAEPLAGAVFRCRPGVRGLPATPFAG